MLGLMMWIVGGLARVGPNFLVTNDPNQMRKMLAARSPYLRSDWYVGMKFDPSRENITSERNEKKHADLRSKMALGVRFLPFSFLKWC